MNGTTTTSSTVQGAAHALSDLELALLDLNGIESLMVALSCSGQMIEPEALGPIARLLEGVHTTASGAHDVVWMAIHQRTQDGCEIAAPRSGDGGGSGQFQNPDADLIALCAQRAVNRRAYNTGAGPDAEGPLWAAYEQTRDAIGNSRPQTMAGVLAKIRAAKGEAVTLKGTEDPEGTAAALWSWQIANDILTLHGAA